MKITTYKVPVKLKRDSSGHVEMEFDENARTKLGSREVSDDTRDIVTLSKQLSDNNEKQKSIAKMVLGANETEKQIELQFEYLE